MGSQERKKKHKKKDKDDRESKKKSKKQKSPRERSRKKKREEQSPQNTKMLSDKQLSDMFGNLQGFNLDYFKKMQDSIAHGKKPFEGSGDQTFMGLSGLLPFISQQIPIQLPQTGTIYKKSARYVKNMKTSFKQRLLIPLSVDSMIPIIEDPFFQDLLPDDILKAIQSRIVHLMRKRITEQKQDQKQEDFNEKVDKLLESLKQQINETESIAQLNYVESVLSAWEGKQQSNVDDAAKDLFKIEKDEVDIVNPLFDEAKALLDN